MKKIILLSFLFWGHLVLAQTILGIDVSHHQGNINWTLVANDGKVFAYCKATEGHTYQDPNFTTYMVNGTNAGVVMGAYHFARPDNNTALEDADNFITAAQAYIGSGYLPPALDLEDPNSSTHLDQLFSSSQLTSWVQTWMNQVENQTGVRPIIYLSSHYAAYLNSSLNSYGLWIAKPNTSPTTPPTNIGNWNDWVIKQYDWYGSVNGISGDVDLDVFHGTNTDFNNWISTNGIGNNLRNLLHFYPNPVTDVLYVKNESGQGIQNIKLYDLNGRLLKTFNQDFATLDLTNLHSGIYFLDLKMSSHKNIKWRFIKK